MPALQSSIANGCGCTRQNREKAVHRRWCRGGRKTHSYPLLISKRKKLLKFECLAEASQLKYGFHMSFKNDRNTAKSRHDNNPIHMGCGYSFSGSQISSSISFSRMSLGVTGAVDYPQYEATGLQCCTAFGKANGVVLVCLLSKCCIPNFHSMQSLPHTIVN